VLHDFPVHGLFAILRPEVFQRGGKLAPEVMETKISAMSVLCGACPGLREHATLNFVTGEPTRRSYTRAKVIDMAFFIEGML
jgi:hypothetical protein